MDMHTEYLLRLADNPLMLGQRLCEWCGHAPVLEEDLSLANMALDLLGQARALLAYAGTVEGQGRDEDRLAFLRSASEYRNVVLVELPNGDFAQTTVRNLLTSAFNVELWQALQASGDEVLAAIAAKSAKEARFHLQHAADWVVRLGDGTAESSDRTRAALERLWPYTDELFVTDEVEHAAFADGIGIEPHGLRSAWLARVEPVIRRASLSLPSALPAPTAGKCGRHSDCFAALLAEMQFLQRSHPGATW